jgi:CheY-like chemotaxis protein
MASHLHRMDDYFTPHQKQLDVDFGEDTWPSVLESTGAHQFSQLDTRRALIADAHNDSRMYLRSKLASFGITQIDLATSVSEAKELLAMIGDDSWSYDIIVIDLDLPGGEPWKLLASAGDARLKLLTQTRLSFANRMTAKAKGWSSMGKPLDPSRLNELLNQVSQKP